MGLEIVGKQMERKWRSCEEWMGLEGTIGDGSNARSRGKCQADVTDDVPRMVFVLKTGKIWDEK